MKTKLQFINVGFEFTASPNAKTGTDERYFKPYADSYIRWHQAITGSRPVVDNNRASREKNLRLPTKFSWINENYSADECGCEVSTPIVKSKALVSKYYKTFKEFTKKFGFTTDINKAMCGLGGCHIHMDLSWIKDVEVKRLLVTNIGIYLTNNPQLNWTFNDWNDNVNANTLLYEPDWASDLDDIHSVNDDFVPEDEDFYSYFGGYDKDKTPHRIWNKNALAVDLYKCFACRYDEGYDTVEIRIFDMPNSLERHLLHYDVAMGIYTHCLALAQKGIKLKYKYKSAKEISNLPLKTIISNLKESLKEIKIPFTRVKPLVANIETRYNWTERVKGKVVKIDDTEKNYLL